MEIGDARRVMETSSHETANQYLRFGWKMINQYVVEATADRPAAVNYVLASVRNLHDTKELIDLTDVAAVNHHLQLGWRLIDKYLTGTDEPERRRETLHFILAWQNEENPVHPGDEAVESTIYVDEGPKQPL